MKPNPRILLGQRLYWTEKKDGSCIAIWLNKKKKVIVSSRNQENASADLQFLVRNSEDFSKIVELLNENPQFVIYVEACRKGRSITGIEFYERNTLFLFDIFDREKKKFLTYVNVHQYAFHYKIPVVKLYAETKHRSMKDLLKFKNHVLEYCESMKIEGMVIKAYKIPEQFKDWHELDGGLLQAKVKLDIPEPTVRKIAKGEAILPPIPDTEIFGAIDKVWQELGNKKFKDVKIAMPKIAEAVKEECKKHLYSSSSKKLFSFYNEYLERMMNAKT